jgi:hypothetical protein
VTATLDKLEWTTLAWGGWRMQVPGEWRPLEIEGGTARGRMVLGDGGTAVLALVWSRATKKRHVSSDESRVTSKDKGGWSKLRVAPLPSIEGADGGIEIRYSRFITRDKTQDARRASVCDKALHSLGTSPPGDPIDWSVFQTSFRVPARFDVVSRRFLPGHMAMLFRSPEGERLVLRQAYPRQAALARRDLAGWLRSEPFGVQKRRFYPIGPAEPWSVESVGGRLDGLIRRGRRRLPAPLGWVAPRWSVGVIVEDPRLDRLLLAECESRQEQGEELVAQCLSEMNLGTVPFSGRLEKGTVPLVGGGSDRD